MDEPEVFTRLPADAITTSRTDTNTGTNFCSRADSAYFASLPYGAPCRLSLDGRFQVFRFRGLLLNPFKHILHHSITPKGMKIECFFPFHSSTHVKTLA